MSGFWGLNQSGRDSRAFPREQATWNTGQYRNWLYRQDSSWNQGQDRTGQAWNYWQNRMGQGIGDPESIRRAGQAAMPGVDQAIQNRWNRWGNIQNNYNDWRQTYGAGNAMNSVYDSLNEQAGNIWRQRDTQQSEIDDTARRMMERDEAASRGVRETINDTFNSATANWNNSYNDLIQQVRDTYAGMRGESDQAYGTMMTDLERLKPGSEANIARVARSYAPMMSNTMSRMRRGGINPNSVQAGGVLSQAEAERARGMDDAAAEGDQQYIAGRRGVLGAQLGTNLGIAQGANDRTTGLGTAQAGGNLNLTLGRGEALTEEQRRALAASQGIDATRSGLTLTNNQNAFQGTQDWLNRRAQAGLLGRDLAMQDLNMQNQIEGGMIDEEMVGPNAQLQQWLAGQNYANLNTGAMDRAGAQATGIGGNDLALALQSGNLARGFGNDAFAQHMANLQIQSQNAGWGRRLLAGLAGPIVDYFAPGLGSFASGMIGGGQGGNNSFQFDPRMFQSIGNYFRTPSNVQNLPAPPSWLGPWMPGQGDAPSVRP